MRVIPLEKVILNSNIATEDYSLSTVWTNYYKSKTILKYICVFLCLRHRQVAVDRWLDIGSLLTLNTLTLPFQLNIAGVIVLSKD